MRYLVHRGKWYSWGAFPWARWSSIFRQGEWLMLRPLTGKAGRVEKPRKKTADERL